MPASDFLKFAESLEAPRSRAAAPTTAPAPASRKKEKPASFDAIGEMMKISMTAGPRRPDSSSSSSAPSSALPSAPVSSSSRRPPAIPSASRSEAPTRTVAKFAPPFASSSGPPAEWYSDIMQMKNDIIQIKVDVAMILAMIQERPLLSEFEPANDNSDFDLGENIAARDMQMLHDRGEGGDDGDESDESS